MRRNTWVYDLNYSGFENGVAAASTPRRGASTL
jgi:hypothetical protein